MKDLKKFIARVKRAARIVRSARLTVSPKRDWYIILAVSTVLTMILIGVGVFRYHGAHVLVNVWSAEPGAAAVRAPDIENLAQVLGAFRERTMRFERLRAEPDPAPVLDRHQPVIDAVEDLPVEIEQTEVVSESDVEGGVVVPESVPTP